MVLVAVATVSVGGTFVVVAVGMSEVGVAEGVMLGTGGGVTVAVDVALCVAVCVDVALLVEVGVLVVTG